MPHNSCRNSHLVVLALIAFLAVLVAGGCGGPSGSLPIESIRQTMADTPTYSVILDDMKEEGNFFSKFYHKYRIVQPEDTGTTDWLEVPENYYRLHEEYLGMALFSKKDGEEIDEIAPPGYAYVGDSRYGRWRDDGQGGSFWEFYGKYALLSHLFGGWYRPVYRTDYDMYRQYRSRRRPYFGNKNQYGTSGSIAKTAKPDFFSRRKTREQLKRTSFKERVAKRTGRVRTGFRSRAGGIGK